MHAGSRSLAVRHAAARWLRRLLNAALALLLAWEVLAIGYFPLLPAPARWPVAAAVGLFCVWGLWRSRQRWPRWVVGALFGVSWLAWAGIAPSLERDWRPEVAVMPRIAVDGDRVHISGYRHFDYRSASDFTPRYEERTVRLSQLRSVDFLLSYWQQGPVAHTFASFNFDDAAPVSISIETRPEVGEGFDPLASLFKHFELIYVVGDERDLVRVRTNYRQEDVFLYRTNLSRDAAQRLFLIYAERINELAVRPEFYHLLSNSCTINIVRYANRIGRVGPLDIRHVLNGLSDRYLYRAGVVDTSLPFDTLRALAHQCSGTRRRSGRGLFRTYPPGPAGARRAALRWQGLRRRQPSFQPGAAAQLIADPHRRPGFQPALTLRLLRRLSAKPANARASTTACASSVSAVG